MNVAAILGQKGRAITTAQSTTTLLEVANKLAAKRFGAIVIVGAKGAVTGIISERDIIRCLARPVSESMTRHVVGFSVLGGMTAAVETQTDPCLEAAAIQESAKRPA